jgi:hypothetical protein
MQLLHSILVKTTQIDGIMSMGSNPIGQQPNFPSVIFIVETKFYINGEVNHQNVPYWSDSDLHWMTQSKI